VLLKKGLLLQKRGGIVEEKVFFYTEYTDDVITSANQEYVLPKDYDYERKSFWKKLAGVLVYGLAIIYTFFYANFYLGFRVYGKEKYKKERHRGIFVYGNHTQMIGDAFIPAWGLLGRRIYVLVSPANYGIPVIGKILPALGAIPIPQNLAMMKDFNKDVERKIQKKHPVVIYPEAHVWPYYTGIRVFNASSFHYPVSLNAPVYVMTNTYQKRRFIKRPRLVSYIDGPFYPDTAKSPKEQRENLRETVLETLRMRAKNSNCEYIKYVCTKQVTNE